MTYQDQIKHPKWQKKRLEVLKYFKWACKDCGAKDQQLHVHHPFYKRGAMIWGYKKEELICLCHDCHKATHALKATDKIKAQTQEEACKTALALDDERSMTEFWGSDAADKSCESFFAKMKILLGSA